MNATVDTAVLVICAVTGAAFVFLLLAGENVSRWIRSRREGS